MIPLTIYLIIHHGNDSLFQNRHKRDSQNSQVLIPTILIYILLGHALVRARTIALDPTFGSFTLLKPISHYVNQFLWWKCLDCFGVQNVNTVGRCTTSYLLAGPACLWCLVYFRWGFTNWPNFFLKSFEKWKFCDFWVFLKEYKIKLATSRPRHFLGYHM